MNENPKSQGEQNIKYKKKNLGRVGRSRSDGNTSQRGMIVISRRKSHHSRRQVLNAGVKEGADSMWLPSTSCVQSRKHAISYSDTCFDSFKKWRYLGDICKMPDKSVDDLKEIKRILQEIPDEDINQIACIRCRYFYQYMKKLPEIKCGTDANTIKEIYRNRNISLMR